MVVEEKSFLNKSLFMRDGRIKTKKNVPLKMFVSREGSACMRLESLSFENKFIFAILASLYFALVIYIQI